MKSNRFTDYNTVGVVQKQKKILLWKSVLNLCLVNKKQKEQQQKKTRTAVFEAHEQNCLPEDGMSKCNSAQRRKWNKIKRQKDKMTTMISFIVKAACK